MNLKKLVFFFLLVFLKTSIAYSLCYEEKQTNYTLSSWTILGENRMAKQEIFVKTDYIKEISILINKTSSSPTQYGNITLKFYDYETNNLLKEVSIDLKPFSSGLFWLNFSLDLEVEPFKKYYFIISSNTSWLGSIIILYGVDFQDIKGPYKVGNAYYFDGTSWIDQTSGFWGVDYSFKLLSNCYDWSNKYNVLFYYGWLNITGGYYKVCRKCFQKYKMSIIADKNLNSLNEIKNYTETYLYYPLGSSFASSTNDSLWYKQVIEFIDNYSPYLSGGFFFDEVDPGYFFWKNISFFNNSLANFSEYIRNKGLKVIINGHRFYSSYGDYYLWENFIIYSNYSIANFFSTPTNDWESNLDKYLYLKNNGMLKKTIILSFLDVENNISLLEDAIIINLFARGLGFEYFSLANTNLYATLVPNFDYYTFYNYYNSTPEILLINNSGVWIKYKNMLVYLDLNQSFLNNKLIYKKYYENADIFENQLIISKIATFKFYNPTINGSNLVNISLIFSNSTKRTYAIESDLLFDYVEIYFPKKFQEKVVKVEKCDSYDASFNCLSGWYQIPYEETASYVKVRVNSFSLFSLTLTTSQPEIKASLFSLEILKEIFKLIKLLFNND